MSTSDHIRSFSKRLHVSAKLDPVRDWLMLLMLAMIMLIGIIVWNIWAFDTVARGGTIGAPTVQKSESFNRTSLDAVKDIFKKRAEEEIKYETGVYRFADPSQ